MDALIIGVILVVSFFALLTIGLPIAFAMGGLSALGVLLLMGPEALKFGVFSTWSTMSSFILVAIPLFIFMANILGASGIADDLYRAIARWSSGIRGGLAAGTVVICMLFAAMVGVIGAAIVTMALVALPEMLKRKYDKHLVCGGIAAGGALGVLIPPSVQMILYALVVGESVGRMFAGGMFPGILLGSLYMAYILIRSYLQPHLAPVSPADQGVTWKERFVSLRNVIIPVLIVVLVLGSIFGGFATPTEAAGVGAFSAIIFAVVNRKLNWEGLKTASYNTAFVSGMVGWLLVGVGAFDQFLSAAGILDKLVSAVASLSVNRWLVIIIMQLSLFVLGAFLDDYAIIILVAPIYVPIVETLGFNPLWFGILFIVNMQMAVLTPPYGFALFYLRSVVPSGITMGDLYRSTPPFIALQAIGLITIMIFPQIALWLPKVIFPLIG